MTKRPSPYSNALQERNFRKVPKEISTALRATIPTRLTRRERRALASKKYKPWFTEVAEGDLTLVFATDETGQTWLGKNAEGLEKIGFENRTGDAEMVGRTLTGKTTH